VYNGRLKQGAGGTRKGVRTSLDRSTRRDALFVLGAAAVLPARAEVGLLRAMRVDRVCLAVGDIDKAMISNVVSSATEC